MMTQSHSKTCHKCGCVKPEDEFYVSSGNTCKACIRARVSQNYLEKREQYAAYERERFQRPERKAKALEYQRTRRRLHADRNAARQAVSNALRDGKLSRGACAVCGASQTEAHHMDYGRPLDVTWLCRKHHLEAHGKQVYEFSSREAARAALGPEYSSALQRTREGLS